MLTCWKPGARDQRSFAGQAEVASGSQSFAGNWVKRFSALCLEPLDQLAPGHCRLPASQFGGPWQLQGSLSFADSYGYSVHPLTTTIYALSLSQIL